MESYSTGSSSFESDDDKDKEKSTEKKKLRMPLPASEVHANEPKKPERIIPLFAKIERKDTEGEQAEADKEAKKKEAPEPVEQTSDAAPVKAEKTEEPSEDTAAAQPTTPHKDLNQLHNELWDEFDQTEARVEEPTHTERAAGEKPKDKPELTMPEPGAPTKETTPDSDDLWHEFNTVHLNGPARPEDAIPAAPSAAGMTAEVAATESDPESEALWNEFNTAPPAEVPEWHPEAEPVTYEGHFQRMMNSANMGEEFNRASSAGSGQSENAQPEPTRTQPAASAGRGVGGVGFFGGAAAAPGSGPDAAPVPAGFSQPENTQPAADRGYEPQPWYPAPDPRYARPGFRPGSMAGRAAEAALLTSAAAGMGAAHGAETGLVAGAAAGAVAGGVAGYAAGRGANRREIRNLRRDAEERDQQINTLTTEQEQTDRKVEGLTRSNEQLTQQAIDQQKAVAEAAAISAAAAAAKERVSADNPEEKVVRSEWLDAVYDKRTGKLVDREGVNNFGSEFEAEKRAEAVSYDPVATALAAAQAAAQATADVDTYDKPQADHYGQFANQGQLSSQFDPTREITAGYGDGGMADFQHRLPAPRNPILAALTSPLLWIGVVVLLVAFFVAAFH